MSHGAYESLPYSLQSLDVQDMEFLGLLVIFSEIGIAVSFVLVLINVMKHFNKNWIKIFMILMIVIVIVLFAMNYFDINVQNKNETTIIIDTALPYVCGSERFQPPVVRVIVGINNTITWKNLSPFTQSIVSVDGSFSSGPIPPGGKWVYTFTKPGIYRYRNGFYAWVQGVIIVDK